MTLHPRGRRVILDLPAPGPHEIFAQSAADSLVGQTLKLDERIAAMWGLDLDSLSADERGLWRTVRVIAAELIWDGRGIGATVEPAVDERDGHA